MNSEHCDSDEDCDLEQPPINIALYMDASSSPKNPRKRPFAEIESEDKQQNKINCDHPCKKQKSFQPLYGLQLSQQMEPRQFTEDDAFNPSNDLMEKYKQLETENTLDIAFEEYSTPNCSKIVGKWKIEYKIDSGNQCRDLNINEDGSFVQIHDNHSYNYDGKWWIKGGLIVLEYSSLKLTGEKTPIRLQCELNADLNVFNGVKTHPDYKCYNTDCCLVYVGKRSQKN